METSDVLEAKMGNKRNKTADIRGTFGAAFALAILMTLPASADPTSGYKNGFFLSAEDGSSTLQFNGRGQVLFAYESLGGIGEGQEDKQQFSIPRVRLKMSGHLWSKDLEYTFQTDFGKGGATLKDFHVDFKLMDDWVHLRAGQWKRPFSRQQINSSGKLEFVDRALTDKAFGAGRDIGMAIHSRYRKGGFTYTAGIFNGTGITAKTPWETDEDLHPDAETVKVSNVPYQFHPVAALRLEYSHGGIKGYSEADLEGGGFRFALGGSALYDLDLDDSGDGSMVADLDYAVKAAGFSSTGGYYMAMAENADGQLEGTLRGFHAQAGYVIADQYQPVVRFTMLDPEGDDNNTQKITAGMNLYFKGHNLKWQTDVGIAMYEAPEGEEVNNDVIVRSQLQLAF
jgi:hypothetical protein